MSEKELINQYTEFGYLVKKYGNKYSIFDKRLARRTAEADNLEQLSNYAEKILLFPFMKETLEKTVDTFSEMYARMYPEIVTGEEQEQDPEQESSPVSPVTDQDTEDQEEPEPAAEQEKDSPVLYTKTCKGCGKQFQTAHKQSMYCSPACYPSSKKEKKSQEVEQESGCSVLPRPF